ncbi:MAG: OmpH family outer membrane protein [Paracoccaceae bacterium]|nr:OmpH family outer membrane protein [Paracoccaceae bacterium]
MLAFSFGTPIFAQESAETPETPQTIVVLQSAILVIDLDQFFANSLFGRRIQAEFQEARAELLAENSAKFAELTSEEKDLTERRSTLGREEFSVLAEEFDTKAQKIRAEQTAKGSELQARPGQARQQFLSIAQDVLIEIMRERRALAVLSQDAVLIPADSINITVEAISRIDALLGDGSN